MAELPTPHFEKLTATLENAKLPAPDRRAIRKALRRYAAWVDSLKGIDGSSSEAVDKLANLLNDYRMFLDVEVIFDSRADFLYRQKGQLKLDNSVIEEFLPHLIMKCLGTQIEDRKLQVGPSTSFSSVYFSSSLDTAEHLGGFSVRTKNQDFAICLPL